MRSKNLEVVKRGYVTVEQIEQLREDISEHFNNWHIELANLKNQASIDHKYITANLSHRYSSVYTAYQKPSSIKVSIEHDIKSLMEYLQGEDYGVDSRNSSHFTASFKVNSTQFGLTYIITFTHAHTILWI